MNPHQLVVECRDVGKTFCRDLRKSLWYGLKDSCSQLLGGRADTTHLRDGEFWANKDISFELKRGECLGLIGHNGAGKTTLLKMLNGLIQPNVGHIRIRGRVGALIALGAGFNPLLTGRENVFVNSSVLGRTRAETIRAFDEIVEFAEVEDAIDAPVRTYSSGMQVRLGFAIAAQVNPEVLLVDEVLAVGDNAFQKKCYDRIYEMRENGTSFVVVSHNPYQLERLCDFVAAMSDGRILTLAEPKEAIHLYHTELKKKETTSEMPVQGEGTGQVRIENVTVRRDGVATNEAAVCEEIELEMVCHFLETMTDVRFRFTIFAASNAIIANIGSNSETESIVFEPGVHRVSFRIPENLLLTGVYWVDGIVAQSTGLRIATLTNATTLSVTARDQRITDRTGGVGILYTNGDWSIRRAERNLL